MESASTYLKKLKFDPKLLKNFIAKYLTNLRLGLLIILAITAFGVQSYLALPRNLNPEIKIPIIIVSTVLPGANPADIESLVTIPIEDAVAGVSDIKQVNSTSRESVSLVQIEFESGVDPEKAKSDIQSTVDGIGDLPEDSQEPNVQKLDFENQPIWVFNLSGAGDRASLIRFSRDLKRELEDLGSIDKVNITGLDESEIQIVIKSEAISNYSVNPQQLSSAIKSGLSSFPAGNVRTEGGIFSFTIDPVVTGVGDIRDLKINISGNIISLGDIAEIKEISKPDQNESYILADGKISKSVSFNVFRLKNVNFDKANEDAQEKVKEKLKLADNRFKLYTVINTAEQIEKEFSELQRDILITIVLVFIVLLLFLGIRQAVISLFSIPLTFLITFVVMNSTGIALSFIATFSLLLSLGLLVDDTIVVISAMTAYYRAGRFTPLQTGLLVWKDFWIAILTTTITTVWAFIPLLLSTGIIGEFIKPIPIVVSSTLIASIFVALFITLPFMIFLLKPQIPFRVKVLLRIILIGIILGLFYSIVPKSQILVLQLLIFLAFIAVTYQVRGRIAEYIVSKLKIRPTKTFQMRIQGALDRGIISFRGIEIAYNRVIHRILNSKNARRKSIVMVLVFSICSYLLVPAGFVKSEFFPKTDEDNLYMSVELPSGTNLQNSKTEALGILEQLKDTPETKFITLELGQEFSQTQGPGSSGANNFLYSFALVEGRERKLNSSEIAQSIRNKFADYDEGKISVIEVSGGPPAGADLQIKLFGDDLSVLDRYANRIQDFLAKEQGITNIDKTIKAGTSKLTFIPDKIKLAQNNITVDSLGFWLRLFASGFKADDLKFTGEDLTEDINIRLSGKTPTAEEISKINIPTQDGRFLPILSLGELKLETNPSLITREDGKRTLSVTAAVTKGFNVADKNRDLEKFAGTLNLPQGYGWATGGVNEENQESVNSILRAMVLSFILIITTMVLQFRSFRRALIVMLVIPLSISGVFIIFALTQTPLSFPALIGILALFGIVVKNSILIVDKILINEESGMEFRESVADAAASRLEPIALTSIAAIVGLIPITITDPLWRGLGGAIIAGLTFSGTIMLFFIPVVYYLIYNPYKNYKRS